LTLVPVVAESLPTFGLRLHWMVPVPRDKVAVKLVAAPPALTVAAVGEIVRLGAGGLTVICARDLRLGLATLAARVTAVRAVIAAGGV